MSLMKSKDDRQRFTSVHSHQSPNGTIVYIGWLYSTLLEHCQQRRKATEIYFVVFMHQELTDVSPYYFMFGREPQLSVDIEFGLSSSRGPVGETLYSIYLMPLHLQPVTASLHKKHNRKLRGRTFSVGYIVWLRNKRVHFTDNKFMVTFPYLLFCTETCLCM